MPRARLAASLSLLVIAPITGCGDALEEGSGGATSSAAGAAPSTSASGGSTATSSVGGSGSAGTGGDAPVDPVPEADCHPREVGSARGAYFRKVQSDASSAARAIHAVGMLPEVELDLARWFHTDAPGLQFQNGPLDRPSVYMGGRSAGVEVDAGFTWDRVYTVDGAPTWTDRLPSASDGDDPEHRFVLLANGDVATVTGVVRPEGLEGLIENFAFRPFWRADGGWHNPPVGSADNQYWYPGEGFRMLVAVWNAQELVLIINHGTEGDANGLEVHFDVSGWEPGTTATFKRVNSIDQFTVIDGERIGLETAGLDVLPTETVTLAMQWQTVRILGAGSVELSKLDCDAQVVTGADDVFETHYDDIFLLYDQTTEGGETNDVLPGRGP